MLGIAAVILGAALLPGGEFRAFAVRGGFQETEGYPCTFSVVAVAPPRVTAAVGTDVRGTRDPFVWEQVLRYGETRVVRIRFTEAGDKVVAQRDVPLRCGRDADLPADGAVTTEEQGGKPSFHVSLPPFIWGGATATLVVEIKGAQTEKWYCPRVEVFWPDGTRAVRESDCAPWPPAEFPSRRWTFQRAFGRTSTVEACIFRGQKMLSCQIATVKVVGEGEE